MSDTTDRSGILWAAGGGAVAYVLGYVLTYLAASTTVETSGLNQLLEAIGEGGSVTTLVGWVFYNAHFVPTTITVDVPILGGSSTVNLIAESPELSPVLYLIPPALLLAAGLAAVRVVGATERDLALRIGPAVAIGYLPLAVVGAFVFSVSVGGSGGQPALLSAVALAGVGYPLVFGTIGALAGTVLGSRD